MSNTAPNEASSSACRQDLPEIKSLRVHYLSLTNVKQPEKISNQFHKRLVTEHDRESGIDSVHASSVEGSGVRG
jgi:hypothetical protein